MKVGDISLKPNTGPSGVKGSTRATIVSVAINKPRLGLHMCEREHT